MVILGGIACLIAGIVMTIRGISLNGDISARILDEHPGTVWIVLGVVLVLVGIVTLYYIYKRKKRGF
ncbi:MAG: hypothetical protein LBR85_00435 [Oscillospiraceae bacterium]|jgi:membrane protein DedA with SNARE-associated domain|nr:hypothetical protein [Oscillospiraceae bacterium]